MKLLREPLLHFLVIGAVLFGVFNLTGGEDEAAPDEIVVSAGQIASMKAIFSRTWQRPPTDKEVEALVSEYVRDEIIYREGVAMGLDRDDSVVRRRIRQKMEFVADLTAGIEPTEAELKAFVADHPDLFRTEPSFSFSQVYFPAGTGTPNAGEMEVLLDKLNAGAVDATKIGKPLLAGSDFQNLGRSDVKQTFGEDFARWMDRAERGAWQGPVSSGYGTHLVRVSERVEAKDLPFEAVREAALRELLYVRKVEANKALYDKLRSRYTIRVEDASGEGKLAKVLP